MFSIFDGFFWSSAAPIVHSTLNKNQQIRFIMSRKWTNTINLYNLTLFIFFYKLKIFVHNVKLHKFCFGTVQWLRMMSVVVVVLVGIGIIFILKAHKITFFFFEKKNHFSFLKLRCRFHRKWAGLNNFFKADM